MASSAKALWLFGQAPGKRARRARRASCGITEILANSKLPSARRLCLWGLKSSPRVLHKHVLGRLVNAQKSSRLRFLLEGVCVCGASSPAPGCCINTSWSGL